MEDTTQSPISNPPAGEAGNQSPTPSLSSSGAGKPLLPTWLIAAVVVIVGTLAVWWAVGMFSRGEQLTPETAEISPTVTPTPIRTPSALATQSAFLALEEAVASLSAHIQGLPISDPSLTPPSLELELGFSQ